MKVLLTGGGTAGHLYPLIAVIRQMKKNYPYGGFDFYYLGPRDKFVKNTLKKEGVKVKTIFAGKFRRYFSLKNFIDVFKIPLGILQSFYYIFVISPDVIFSKGGYGSIPVTVAGKMLMVPMFLHESDIIPGLANKLASKFALEVFIAFSTDETKGLATDKMLSVGNPVKEELLMGSKESAKERFKLTGEKPVLVILGGSQGARKINNTILANLQKIVDKYEVIHQTGKRNFNQVEKEVKIILPEESLKYYHPSAFLAEEELADAYAVADLIISRAGAGTIFEIASSGKPSILIPLANSAQDHQVRNAYAYAQRGAGLVIEEANFKPNFILERINYLFDRPEKMEKMSQRAKDFSRPEAARIIADYLVTYLTQ